MVEKFVACTSSGGAYDDQAFVAGYRLGTIATALAQPHVFGMGPITVEDDLVEQCDLTAMRFGYRMDRGPSQDGWTVVTFVYAQPVMEILT
jgi:hypothetical protein